MVNVVVAVDNRPIKISFAEREKQARRDALVVVLHFTSQYALISCFLTTGNLE